MSGIASTKRQVENDWLPSAVALSSPRLPTLNAHFKSADAGCHTNDGAFAHASMHNYRRYVLGDFALQEADQ